MKIAKTTTTRRRIDSFTASQLRAITRRKDINIKSQIPPYHSLPVVTNARIGPYLKAAIIHPKIVAHRAIKKTTNSQYNKVHGNNQVQKGTASDKSMTIIGDINSV